MPQFVSTLFNNYTFMRYILCLDVFSVVCCIFVVCRKGLMPSIEGYGNALLYLKLYEFVYYMTELHCFKGMHFFKGDIGIE